MPPQTKTITLAVAFSQAFLFTFAMISLINVRWMEGRRFFRELMGVAYLFFAAINVVEYLFRDAAGDNHLLTQTITLAVAFSQSFLFTWSMIALLNVRWMDDRWRSCAKRYLS